MKRYLALVMLLMLVSPVYGDNPDQKAVLVRVNIKNNAFTILERKVVYGYAPEHFVQWQDFKIRLLSENGVIEEYGVIDPRIRFYEALPGEPEGFKARMVDEANLTLIFPFNSNLTGVSVNNYTSGAELVKADLKDMIASFCSQNRNDSDCAGVAIEPGGTPAAPSDFAPLVGLLVVIALVALGLWQLRRRK